MMLLLFSHSVEIADIPIKFGFPFFYKYLLIGTELFIFVSFIWAMLSWLVKTTVLPRWELKFIKAGGLLFMLAHLIAASFYPYSPNTSFIAGYALLLLSAALFWWSVSAFEEQPPAVAFSKTIVTSLNTEGPYRFIRHPLYTSYALAWLGGTLATGCWWLLISFFAMGYVYVVAAHEEENQWLSGKEKDSYKKYKAQTGRFLPDIFKLFRTRKAAAGYESI